MARGIRIGHLDSVYLSAVDVDTARAVRAVRVQEISTAYVQLLQGLGNFLKAHQFVWGKPKRGFNRIYFGANGTVDYYLYKFKPGEIDPAREAEFRRLLGEFILTNKLDLRLSRPFAQCSPVTYNDAPAKKAVLQK